MRADVSRRPASVPARSDPARSVPTRSDPAQGRAQVAGNRLQQPHVEVDAKLIRDGDQHGIRCRHRGVAGELFHETIGISDVAAPEPGQTEPISDANESEDEAFLKELDAINLDEPKAN